MTCQAQAHSLPEHRTETTPLPMRKLTILSLILLVNNVSTWMIFPMIPFMVHHFYPELADTEVHRVGCGSLCMHYSLSFSVLPTAPLIFAAIPKRLLQVDVYFVLPRRVVKASSRRHIFCCSLGPDLERLAAASTWVDFWGLSCGVLLAIRLDVAFAFCSGLLEQRFSLRCWECVTPLSACYSSVSSGDFSMGTSESSRPTVGKYWMTQIT